MTGPGDCRVHPGLSAQDSSPLPLPVMACRSGMSKISGMVLPRPLLAQVPGPRPPQSGQGSSGQRC